MPRQYIRHPAQIPIKVEGVSKAKIRPATTHNISLGGLACESDFPFSPGTSVEVIIPLLEPPFSTQGHVIWCEHYINHYLLGIGFDDNQQAYSVRMIEQICHIETYRQRILEQQGRELTSEQAAAEWIQKYAKHFPDIH